MIQSCVKKRAGHFLGVNVTLGEGPKVTLRIPMFMRRFLIYYFFHDHGSVENCEIFETSLLLEIHQFFMKKLGRKGTWLYTYHISNTSQTLPTQNATVVDKHYLHNIFTSNKHHFHSIFCFKQGRFCQSSVSMKTWKRWEINPNREKVGMITDENWHGPEKTAPNWKSENLPNLLERMTYPPYTI